MWHLLLALPHAYAGPRALNLVGLEALAPAFEAAGAETDADLALLTDADLAALGLNLVQRRKLQRHLELQRHQGVVENWAEGLDQQLAQLEQYARHDDERRAVGHIHRPLLERDGTIVICI